MKEIIIERPYIRTEKGVARLEAIIKGPNFNKVHYFEVQEEYGKYLCYERSDAFVLSLLFFALVNGYNIRCDAPMSEKLYYQLTRILIPSLTRYSPELFANIEIETEIDSIPIKNAKAVGAAVSGGVDSFYTIVTNLNQKASSFNITHLLVGNSYNIFYGDKDTRKRFEETVNNSKVIADELGLPLITIYSNHSEFWFKYYQNMSYLKYSSYTYALQKLFSVYLYSSSFEYVDFDVTPKNHSIAHFDPLTAPQLSNENFTFILSGAELGRAEKILAIADNPVVQKYLQVCNLQQENCSECPKCMRTQYSLYINGKLELFTQSFDINKFYKNKDKVLTDMLKVRGIFDVDNLNQMKKNSINIPFKIKFVGKVKRIYHLFRQLLKSNSFILKIYKCFVKDIPNDEYYEINKYNTDKEYAKKCDEGIV